MSGKGRKRKKVEYPRDLVARAGEKYTQNYVIDLIDVEQEERLFCFL